MWIARDKDGPLWAFKHKPKLEPEDGKFGGYWCQTEIDHEDAEEVADWMLGDLVVEPGGCVEVVLSPKVVTN